MIRNTTVDRLGRVGKSDGIFLNEIITSRTHCSMLVGHNRPGVGSYQKTFDPQGVVTDLVKVGLHPTNSSVGLRT